MKVSTIAATALLALAGTTSAELTFICYHGNDIGPGGNDSGGVAKVFFQDESLEAGATVDYIVGAGAGTKGKARADENGIFAVTAAPSGSGVIVRVGEDSATGQITQQCLVPTIENCGTPGVAQVKVVTDFFGGSYNSHFYSNFLRAQIDAINLDADTDNTYSPTQPNTGVSNQLTIEDPLNNVFVSAPSCGTVTSARDSTPANRKPCTELPTSTLATEMNAAATSAGCSGASAGVVAGAVAGAVALTGAAAFATHKYVTNQKAPLAESADRV